VVRLVDSRLKTHEVLAQFDEYTAILLEHAKSAGGAPLVTRSDGLEPFVGIGYAVVLIEG